MCVCVGVCVCVFGELGLGACATVGASVRKPVCVRASVPTHACMRSGACVLTVSSGCISRPHSKPPGAGAYAGDTTIVELEYPDRCHGATTVCRLNGRIGIIGATNA
jgi:hypothetical protein